MAGVAAGAAVAEPVAGVGAGAAVAVSAVRYAASDFAASLSSAD